MEDVVVISSKEVTNLSGFITLLECRGEIISGSQTNKPEKGSEIIILGKIIEIFDVVKKNQKGDGNGIWDCQVILIQKLDRNGTETSNTVRAVFIGDIVQKLNNSQLKPGLIIAISNPEIKKPTFGYEKLLVGRSKNVIFIYRTADLEKSIDRNMDQVTVNRSPIRSHVLKKHSPMRGNKVSPTVNKAPENKPREVSGVKRKLEKDKSEEPGPVDCSPTSDAKCRRSNDEDPKHSCWTKVVSPKPIGHFDNGACPSSGNCHSHNNMCYNAHPCRNVHFDICGCNRFPRGGCGYEAHRSHCHCCNHTCNSCYHPHPHSSCLNCIPDLQHRSSCPSSICGNGILHQEGEIQEFCPVCTEADIIKTRYCPKKGIHSHKIHCSDCSTVKQTVCSHKKKQAIEDKMDCIQNKKEEVKKLPDIKEITVDEPRIIKKNLTIPTVSVSTKTHESEELKKYHPPNRTSTPIATNLTTEDNVSSWLRSNKKYLSNAVAMLEEEPKPGPSTREEMSVEDNVILHRWKVKYNEDGEPIVTEKLDFLTHKDDPILKQGNAVESWGSDESHPPSPPLKNKKYKRLLRIRNEDSDAFISSGQFSINENLHKGDFGNRGTEKKNLELTLKPESYIQNSGTKPFTRPQMFKGRTESIKSTDDNSYLFDCNESVSSYSSQKSWIKRNCQKKFVRKQKPSRLKVRDLPTEDLGDGIEQKNCDLQIGKSVIGPEGRNCETLGEPEKGKGNQQTMINLKERVKKLLNSIEEPSHLCSEIEQDQELHKKNISDEVSNTKNFTPFHPHKEEAEQKPALEETIHPLTTCEIQNKNPKPLQTPEKKLNKEVESIHNHPVEINSSPNKSNTVRGVSTHSEGINKNTIQPLGTYIKNMIESENALPSSTEETKQDASYKNYLQIPHLKKDQNESEDLAFKQSSSVKIAGREVEGPTLSQGRLSTQTLSIEDFIASQETGNLDPESVNTFISSQKLMMDPGTQSCPIDVKITKDNDVLKPTEEEDSESEQWSQRTQTQEFYDHQSPQSKPEEDAQEKQCIVLEKDEMLTVTTSSTGIPPVSDIQPKVETPLDFITEHSSKTEERMIGITSRRNGGTECPSDDDQKQNFTNAMDIFFQKKQCDELISSSTSDKEEEKDSENGGLCSPCNLQLQTNFHLKSVLVGVEPTITEAKLFNLVSGKCPKCNHITPYSKIFQGKKPATANLCPKCKVKGRKCKMTLMYLFKLIVKDSKTTLDLLTMGSVAEKFISFDVGTYVKNREVARKVIHALEKVMEADEDSNPVTFDISVFVTRTKNKAVPLINYISPNLNISNMCKT